MSCFFQSKMSQINKKPVKAGTIRVETETLFFYHNKLAKIYCQKETSFFITGANVSFLIQKNTLTGIISAIYCYQQIHPVMYLMSYLLDIQKLINNSWA